MRVDLAYYLFRFLLFYFLFTVVVIILYFLGTYQSFLEITLIHLLGLARMLTWSGVLVSGVAIPLFFSLTKRHRLKVLVGIGIFMGFLLFFGSIEFVTVWLYPRETL